MAPFRRPRYRTSHCYSELSGEYWDILSHPMITHIFASDHAQTRATGKGIKSQGCLVYLDMYIAKNV